VQPVPPRNPVGLDGFGPTQSGLCNVTQKLAR
jgi:hypothetical protein